ncbi:MAG: V4R domain-containing protein [Myxococcota bacterium]
MDPGPNELAEKPMQSSGWILAEPAELDRLRREAFESVGPEASLGLLYGIGFSEGVFEALRLLEDGERSLPEVPLAAAPPLVFRPESDDATEALVGSLTCSREAALHQRRYGASQTPVCMVSAGFAAGWYSTLRGEILLVRETCCRASGAPRCTFEARRPACWQKRDATWLQDLLSYLDFNALHAQAEERLEAIDANAPHPRLEGEMMGQFDALSPAAHVWGPVMILPYSGCEDGLLTIGAVQEDVGSERLRVIVIDTTGARINAVEAIGLARLLNALDDRNLEAVLVGVDQSGLRHFSTLRRTLRFPILARDISAGITLGFQIAQEAR